jgi:hypothetical protein
MKWSLEDGMVVRRTGEGRELVWIHGLGEQSASFDRVVALHRVQTDGANFDLDQVKSGTLSLSATINKVVLDSSCDRWLL